MMHQPPTHRSNSVVNDSSSVILQRKCACKNSALGLSNECEECQRQKVLGIQPKLVVGISDDPLEREADRVATQVTQIPTGFERHRGKHDISAIQRKAMPSAGKAQIAPPLVYHAIAEPGQPLSSRRRQFFESRLGHDFSRVRIHTGSSASRSADSISARAYTAGRHVVFGSEHSSSQGEIDLKLMAHELTHVVQQGAAPRLGQSASASTENNSPGRVQRAPRATCVTHMTKIGNRSVCRTPPRPSVMGNRIHGLIAKSFHAESPGNHISEVPIPFAPKSTVHSESSPIVPESFRVLGKVDLVKIVSRGTNNVRIQIGEVKPMKWTGFAQGEAEIRYYKAKIEDAKDECIRYKREFLDPLDSRLSQLPLSKAKTKRRFAMKEAGRLLGSHVFCKKLDAVGKRVTLASQFGLAVRPRTLSLPGRKPRKVLVRTCDDGVITYRCLEKLDDDKKKKKKKGKKSSKKSRSAKKAGSKATKRQAQRAARRTERQVRRQLRKKITDRVARKAIAKTVGKVAARVALKAVPVVGWVMLAIDIAEAANGIYNLVKYGPGLGGSGGPPGGDSEQGAASGGEPGSQEGSQANAAAGSGAPGGTSPTETGSNEEGAGEGQGELDTNGDADGNGGPGESTAGTAHGEGTQQTEIDPELAKLGIFDSEEQAEAYAESLPLSKDLVEALKQSSVEQQQLLELMLAKVNDGSLPKVDGHFFLRLLKITKELNAEELQAIQSAVVPVSSQTLDEVLKRYEEALAALRAGKTLGKATEGQATASGEGKTADRPKSSTKSGSEHKDRSGQQNRSASGSKGAGDTPSQDQGSVRSNRPGKGGGINVRVLREGEEELKANSQVTIEPLNFGPKTSRTFSKDEETTISVRYTIPGFGNPKTTLSVRVTKLEPLEFIVLEAKVLERENSSDDVVRQIPEGTPLLFTFSGKAQ